MSAGQEWLTALGVPAGCIEAKTAAREKHCSFHLVASSGMQALRVRVDGCWLTSTEHRKVDYLFTADLTSGRLCLLVELKGGKYGQALQQIEQTLRHLESLPAYRFDPPRHVRAYVVLSHGNQVPQYEKETERLRLRYGVRVQHKCKQAEHRL